MRPARGTAVLIRRTDTRCLPDQLRKLPRGCAAADLRLRRRVCEDRQRPRRQSLSISGRRCAARRYTPARSVLKAARSWSSPRRRRSFPQSCATAWRQASSSGGMGFSGAARRRDRPAASSPSFDGRTLDICPIHYGSFPEDAPPLTCGCDAASVKTGQRLRRQSLSIYVVAVPRGATRRRDRY